MDDLIGQQLGPYQIVAPLGEGGMAAVYQAFQPGVNRYIALKVLPQYFARDPQFVARFEREAQVLAQLQHPNILPIFDYGQSHGHTYIAMPLIKGGSLAARLQDQRLDFKTIRKIITQVGDALDYAHSRNLIHRDVKPANILIDERGNCLLTDFGLAKIVEGTAKITTSGAIMGTPAYMSPEQGKGWVLDRRTDIYSLGVILYELTVGRAPFEADTPMVVVVKHINDPLPLPSSIIPDFQPALEQVIVTALAKDPHERYQTVSEFVEALNQAFDEIGQTDRGASSSNRSTTPVVSVVTTPVDSPVNPLPSVVAASPHMETATPAQPIPIQKTNQQRAGWVLPVTVSVVILGLSLLTVVGLILFNIINKPATLITQEPTLTPESNDPLTNTPRPFQQLPTLATLQPGADTPQPSQQPSNLALTPPPTPAETGSVLLFEDFEDGEAQDWETLEGDTSIVLLEDGNRVYQFQPSQFGSAQIVFPPAWDWSVEDGLVFEADVRVEDVQPFATTIRLQVRTQAPTPDRACLSYLAELGAGWTGLTAQTAAGDDCQQSEWNSMIMAPQQSLDLIAGEWHHLTVVVYASQIQYFLDDTFIASVNDIHNRYPTGGLSLVTASTNQVYFDNLLAYSLNGQSPLTDEPNWNVTFIYAFAPDSWSVGAHDYTLALNCPNLPAGSASFDQQFEVSDSVDPLGSGRYAFFEIEGVFDDFFDGVQLTAIHPSDNSLAAFNFGALSFSEANLAVTDCAGEFSWDGNSPESLEPFIMFQR